jgi:hypothetical protein
LVTVCVTVESYHGWNIEELAQGFGPNPKMVAVSFDNSRNKNVSNSLSKHDHVDDKLEDDPSMHL